MIRSLIPLFALAAAFVACAPEEDEPNAAGDPVIIAEGTDDLTAAGRRVCTWNVRRLGNNFNSEPKNIDAVATVIRDNCDVIALTEVMVTISREGTDHGGFDEIVAELGDRYWGSIISAKPVPNPPTSNSEYYGFIYRKSAASLCEGWGPNAVQMKDVEDVFIREPAYACFKIKANTQELVLGGYHALFGSPPERKREIGFLDDDIDRNGTPDDLFEAMKASRPAGSNPDVMLIGDFNLTPPELKEVLPRYVDLTNGKGSTINQSNEITDNQYDHALVPAGSRLLAATKPAETLDVRKVVTGTKYYSTVSDHLPIRLILK